MLLSLTWCFYPLFILLRSKVFLKAGFVIHSSAFGGLVSAALDSCEYSWLCCCAESLLVLSGVFLFFFHLLFDTVLSEGGGESWNMTATLKLLSYVEEKGFLEQNPITGEDNVRGYGALLG